MISFSHPFTCFPFFHFSFSLRPPANTPLADLRTSLPVPAPLFLQDRFSGSPAQMRHISDMHILPLLSGCLPCTRRLLQGCSASSCLPEPYTWRHGCHIETDNTHTVHQKIFRTAPWKALRFFPLQNRNGNSHSSVLLNPPC